MANEAIIEAEYVEWKMVKTRKTLQLIFELPLEKQELVQRALGTPLSDVSTPVAIVRLVDKASRPAVEQIEDYRPPAKLSQIAGIFCNEGRFRTFLIEHGFEAGTQEQAAAAVRLVCGVSSRADIDTNEQAAAKFRDLRAQYDAWKLVA